MGFTPCTRISDKLSLKKYLFRDKHMNSAIILIDEYDEKP